MTAKKPAPVHIVLGILFLKLASIIFIIAGFILTKDTDMSVPSFASGMRSVILEKFGFNGDDFPSELGQLTGALTISFLISVFTIAFVYTRRFFWVVGFAVAGILFGLHQGLPILYIAILLLVITEPTKTYLQNKKEVEFFDTLIDEEEV